jgi:two-component system, OmpR family, response regulator TctD
MVQDMKLLLVEDDPSMQTALRRTLQNRGMQVEVCGDGAAALQRWKEGAPDLVLLDLTLPGLDGLLVLEQARRSGLATPVLILTARGTVGDRVIGLNAGADDYLPKPFDLDELEARLRALHRRRLPPGQASAEPGFGGLLWDRQSGAIHWRDEILELAPRETALLHALLARPGFAVPKERLFELVFPGEDDVQYEAIEVVVYRLRKKLVHTGVKLVTLRGLGYLLKAGD